MMTHHIDGTARENILQKLVVQMQQRVFDVILQWYVCRFPDHRQSVAETASAITELM